ncbi:putative B3 domain-containing protein Os04g0347400 [Ananas comosus]|uniref:B3 domain-containing protein Os04g0347400 n=1 Tax=Ananas comosus TaxID=4615 RepID=A0A6P5G308_ANACO|nr:putative B3 domain-containing protein Os04g0347400 [Ananas comosus]
MASGRSSNNPKRPQFFKVLLPGSFDKLWIPRSFADHYINEDCRKATLYSPLGKFWHVNLERSNESNDVFFGGGWREFVRAHDIRVGYLVVFRHEGNMIFTTKVFDLSGCLKAYDETTLNHAGQVLTDIDDGNINVTTNNHSERARRYNFKKRGSYKPISPTPNQLFPHYKNKLRNHSHLTNSSPQFEKTVRPYNLVRKCMNVPETFCMLSGLQDKTVIKLRDSRHRSWPVSFHRYPQFAQLRKGWEEFCEGNNLKEGDKCFFRLVSKKEMHVRIVRN